MQIAEVAKRYGISVDTIRYYERIGLVPHVTRLPNGIRDFTEYDCGWVEFIRCMRESGVQIEALVEYVALFQEGEHTAAARLEILEEQRAKLVAKLEEMQATAKRLDAKIASYRPGGECSDGGDEASSFPHTLLPTRKERPFPALLSTRQGRQWIRRMRPLPTCYIPSP